MTAPRVVGCCSIPSCLNYVAFASCSRAGLGFPHVRIDLTGPVLSFLVATLHIYKFINPHHFPSHQLAIHLRSPHAPLPRTYAPLAAIAVVSRPYDVIATPPPYIDHQTPITAWEYFKLITNPHMVNRYANLGMLSSHYTHISGYITPSPTFTRLDMVSISQNIQAVMHPHRGAAHSLQPVVHLRSRQVSLQIVTCFP